MMMRSTDGPMSGAPDPSHHFTPGVPQFSRPRDEDPYRPNPSEPSPFGNKYAQESFPSGGGMDDGRRPNTASGMDYSRNEGPRAGDDPSIRSPRPPPNEDDYAKRRNGYPEEGGNYN